jgi:hypothetical protein
MGGYYSGSRRNCIISKKRIGELLAEPLIRDPLYWLLYICLIIEEYLIRLLIEE